VTHSDGDPIKEDDVTYQTADTCTKFCMNGVKDSFQRNG